VLTDALSYAATPLLLDVRALSKSFARGLARAQSRTFALLDVDLSLSCGEIACVTGAESAGKTALLQCLAGLLKKDSGTVRWFGQTMIAGCAPPDVIFVPATPLYYPFLTVRDIAQSRSVRAEQGPLPWYALETLAALQLDTRLDCRIADLSREETRCLSIAEALIQRPLALLVDTSPSERIVAGMFSAALADFTGNGGAAMFAMRDAVPIADAASRIIMLHEGVVVRTFSSDPPQLSVKAHPPLLLAETLH